MILKHGDFDGLLNADTRAAVVENLNVQTGIRSFKRDIVSSGLDADKIDYIQRDALHSGVRYGAFDLDKLIDALTVIGDDDQSYLGIEEDGRFVVEQLIQAKWHMTQQVYAHKIRVITDAMLVRGIEKAYEEGNEWIRSVFSYQADDDAYMERYIKADDESVFLAITSEEFAGNLSHTLYTRLKTRNLYKEYAVLSASRHEEHGFVHGQRLLVLGESREARAEAEQAIASVIGCDPSEVIVLSKSIKNPAYSEPETLNPEVIPVLRKSGETVELNHFSNIDLPSLNNEIHGVNRVHVIAPADEDQHKDPVITEEVKEALFA